MANKGDQFSAYANIRRTWTCAVDSVMTAYVELDGKQVCSICK